MLALIGLGGAGKTSLAVEYAHRHLGEVAVAWQFPAEDPAVLAAGFAELAAQLGVSEGGDPVASVHEMLAASVAPWLLVFDNAPDRASVARLVPPAGPGRVLITSRNQIWPSGQALDVPVLDPQAAADFLVNRTGDRDQQAALELADELGGLPLALEQAAAYVQASGETLAGYLALFRRRRTDLLVRGEPTGYHHTVATTWRLAFENLQRAGPGAVGLLWLLAFCAPEAIPLRLLLQPRPGLAGRLGKQVTPVLEPLLEDELLAGDAIATLRRYSLVTPLADGSVSVHRLVQAVTAAQMPAELASQWRQAAAALIEAAIPADTELPGTWPACAALLPHAQAALDLTSDGMWRIAQYLGNSGSYSAARDLFQLIADAHREDNAYGAEHPDTLAARASLAYWTGAAGDPAGARDQFAALLPARERVLGPEHPASLDARASLARWTGAAGDAAGTRDQFAALLPVYERVSGPEHPDTLGARASLASWTGEAGDAAGARDQFAALLPAAQSGFSVRVPGLPHPGRPRQPRLLHRGGRGTLQGPGGPVRRAVAGVRAGSRSGAPRHPARPRQSRPLDRGSGGRCRDPGPVRRAAAGVRAGSRSGAPGHPGRPRQSRSLDRGSGGCGGGPGPVRRAAAGVRAGSRSGAPGHPGRPRQSRLLHRGGRGRCRDPGPVRRTAAGVRAGSRSGAPRHPGRPRQSRSLDRGGGGCGGCPGPVRRAAAGVRAGSRSGASGLPGRPRQSRSLDRGGGGCGGCPGPVRRAAAGARAGVRPGAPGHPENER